MDNKSMMQLEDELNTQLEELVNYCMLPWSDQSGLLRRL